MGEKKVLNLIKVSFLVQTEEEKNQVRKIHKVKIHNNKKKKKKKKKRALQPIGKCARATREGTRHTRTHNSRSSHSGHGSSHHEKRIKRGPRLPQRLSEGGHAVLALLRHGRRGHGSPPARAGPKGMRNSRQSSRGTSPRIQRSLSPHVQLGRHMYRTLREPRVHCGR
jgi:hypothetical protein